MHRLAINKTQHILFSELFPGNGGSLRTTKNKKYSAAGEGNSVLDRSIEKTLFSECHPLVLRKDRPH